MAKARSVTSTWTGRRWWALALATAGLTAGLVGATAAASSAGPKPAASSSAHPHHDRCVTAQCDNAAHSARAAQFPPANPTLPPKAAWMTESTALATARSHAENPAGSRLDAAPAAALHAAAKKMTISAFDVSQGIGADADIAPDRLVWVVTVHGNMALDVPPGHAPVVADVYTDVFDVATGDLILVAKGVDAVS
jgi:hypothetical protein